MPDYGAMYADRQIASITKELKATYRTAQRELKEKLADFNKKFEKKNDEKRKQLESGEITAQQYRDWLTGQVFMRNQWESNIRQVNAVLHDINNQSLNLINSKRLDVFAENYNFNAFRAERETGISFGLYNAQAVAQLVLDDPQLLPEWKIDEEKDYTWNYKKVNNIVKQGIIQGEGVQQITDRLCRDLCTMNENKMKMFARTALTEAQSAGRQQQMQDAHDMGIEVKKQWLATLDGRTRDSHRYLDGKEVPFDKPFKSEFGDIMFPGDLTADAADVFNCRCTIVTIYPKYDTGREDWRQNEVIEGQSYAEWKNGKQRESIENKPIYTQKEKDALHEYTTSTYSGINTLLREGGLSNYPKLKENVEEIDRAMAKSIIPQGTIVSRGATDADLRGMFKEHKRNWFEKYDNLKSLEGETASFDSYLSTTRGATVAEPYKKQVEWVFEVGDGVHGIDMMPFANKGKAEVEREILFAREQNITINKVDCNKDDDGDIYGIITIHATIKKKAVRR